MKKLLFFISFVAALSLFGCTSKSQDYVVANNNAPAKTDIHLTFDRPVKGVIINGDFAQGQPATTVWDFDFDNPVPVGGAVTVRVLYEKGEPPRIEPGVTVPGGEPPFRGSYWTVGGQFSETLRAD